VCSQLNFNKFPLIQPQRSARIHVILITSDLPSNVMNKVFSTNRSGNYNLIPACNFVQILTNQEIKIVIYLTKIYHN